MGRCVSTPSNATAVTYGTLEDDFWDFGEDVIEPFRERIAELFPSAYEVDRWCGREDHAVMANGHAYFGVSAYCGLVAYWMVPKDWDGWGQDTTSLAEAWCRRAAAKFEASFGTMARVGRFSNGGAIYRAKDGGPVGDDNLDGPVIIRGNLCTG